MTAIDVIIVNWNAGHQLLDCIASIRQYGSPYVVQTVVVDNGSTDGSEHALKDMPGVSVILAGENLGFAKACNLGAKYAHSDYLLFLNPDAALYQDTLSMAAAFMEKTANAGVGICGVQLIDEQGRIARSCARFPTAAKFVAQALGASRFIPESGYVMNEWNHGETRDVDHVIGAFYLVRRRLFDTLAGFDERFFVYLEDLDFSYRASRHGWRSVYLADAQAFHAGGGTSNQVKAHRLFYSLRSKVQYACKHFNAVSAFTVLAVTLFAEPVSRSTLALLQMSGSSFKETWTAYAMLWRWLPELFRDKQRIRLKL